MARLHPYGLLPDDLGQIKEILFADFSKGNDWQHIEKGYKHIFAKLPRRIDILFLIQRNNISIPTIQAQQARSGSGRKIEIIGRINKASEVIFTDKERRHDNNYGRWLKDYIQVNADSDWGNTQYVRSTGISCRKVGNQDDYHNRMLCYEIIFNKVASSDINSNSNLIKRTPLFLEGGDILCGILPFSKKRFILAATDIIYYNEENVPRFDKSCKRIEPHAWLEGELKRIFGIEQVIWVPTRWKDVNFAHLDLTVALAGWTNTKDGKQKILIPKLDNNFIIAGDATKQQQLMEIHAEELKQHNQLWNRMAEEIEQQVPNEVEIIRPPAIIYLEGRKLYYLPHLNCLTEYEGESTHFYMPSFVDAKFLGNKKFMNIPPAHIIQPIEAEYVNWYAKNGMTATILSKNFNSTFGLNGYLRCISSVVERIKPGFL